MLLIQEFGIEIKDRRVENLAADHVSTIVLPIGEMEQVPLRDTFPNGTRKDQYLLSLLIKCWKD